MRAGKVIYINYKWNLISNFINVIIERKNGSGKVFSIPSLAKITISFAKGYLLQEPNH